MNFPTFQLFKFIITFFFNFSTNHLFLQPTENGWWINPMGYHNTSNSFQALWLVVCFTLWKNHLYMITMIVFYHILYDWIYSWTCLQWPPWGQKEVATVKRWPLQRGLNKSECMDCPPQKMAIVERWPLVQVRLYMYMTLRNCPGTYPSPFTELNTNLSFRAKCWVRGGLGTVYLGKFSRITLTLVVKNIF